MQAGTKSIVQIAYTVLARSAINGRDCNVSVHAVQDTVLLSCDNVLKSDWFSQLSGS